MREMVRESDCVSLDLVMVEWHDAVNTGGGDMPVSIEEGAEEPVSIIVGGLAHVFDG